MTVPSIVRHAVFTGRHYIAIWSGECKFLMSRKARQHLQSKFVILEILADLRALP